MRVHVRVRVRGRDGCAAVAALFVLPQGTLPMEPMPSMGGSQMPTEVYLTPSKDPNHFGKKLEEKK